MSAHRRSSGRGLLGWLFAALLAVGCAPAHLTVNIKSPADSNEGRPLYMVIREVDPKQYLADTYVDVAAKVVTPDKTVLQTVVIYPGTTKQVRVKKPPELPVAIAFLFTTPDGAWQTLLDVPLPEKVELELLENRIRTGANAPPSPQPALQPAAPAAPEKAAK
ncbi:hypothetical protein [Hyalangium rubrum]|uniref:Type VI lipoprotein IgE-like C-terminal domain-containing protein n=1 Tax=Hyalangium rubrum TaxID=3103134 RepID=A0ABU5HHY2_9BACT|nr:hypothetical protein [Hyalangium sp. s54d21]MDY7233078.1 hypothetical protein [Hyalangium sp. s54d21]